MNKFTALFAGIWLGMQIMSAYAAHLLFSYSPLTRKQAGDLAGEMFSVNNYLGLVVWLCAYFILRHYNQRRYHRTGASPKFALFIAILLGINQFLITPVIVALKTNGTNWLLSLAGGDMKIWHSASSSIFLLTSFIGLGLLLRYIKLDLQY